MRQEICVDGSGGICMLVSNKEKSEEMLRIIYLRPDPRPSKHSNLLASSQISAMSAPWWHCPVTGEVSVPSPQEDDVMAEGRNSGMS